MEMSKRMMKKQKQWLKPQLIVLGRGNTEENVLVACKQGGGGIKGPGTGGGTSGNCAQPAGGCVTLGPS